MGIPMAYNTGTTNTYTEKTVKRGTVALNPGPSLAPSYNWFNGVDVTATQYLIYSDTYTTGQATQANSRPTAWTTPDLSDTSLLNLINTLPERIGQTPFLYLPVALKWLYQSNRYFLLKNNFENIVTSGLVLNLDGSWPNSYSGTTTWFDLSGQGNNGTLTNGPTLNTSNGGSIQFDGTNDYCVVNSNSNSSLSGDFSITQWYNAATNDGGYRVIFETNGYRDGTSGIAIYQFSNYFRIWRIIGGTYTELITTSGNTVGLNTWKTFTLVRNSGVFTFYIDTIYSGTYSTDTNNYSDTSYHIGGDGPPTSSYWFQGNIATTQVYNRTLSPAEIMQNFNTQGYRFGYSADTIVTSGLTINLDAANGMSYPGSGTTWYDISQTGGYNFTLRNGASFERYGNISCFSFDGSDDNARWVDTNGIREDIGTECTISIWMNGNGVNLGQSCCRLISFNNNVDINVDYSDYFCMAACNRIGYLPCYRLNFGGLCDGGGGSNTPMYTTDFKLVTVRWSTISDTIDVFVNNSSIYSASLTASPINYRDIKRIALASNAAGMEYSNIRIASMQMYSRRLSDSELTQNYNAQKGRFGL
jgi:hypothetical protein